MSSLCINDTVLQSKDIIKNKLKSFGVNSKNLNNYVKVYVLTKEEKNYIDDYEEYDDLDLVACYWDIDEAFSTMYKKINQDVKFEFRYSIKPVHICMDDAEILFLKEIKDTNSKINIDNILVLLDKKRLYCIDKNGYKIYW